MAGDSQNMERSTLERKDRAELAAVAAALGLKVSSRAKKADIVTLILDAVAEPGAAPSAAGTPAGEDAAPAATGGANGAADAPAAEPTGESDADEAPEVAEAASGGDAEPAAAVPTARSDRGGHQGGGRPGNGNSNGNGNGNGNGAERAGSEEAADANDGADAGEAAEPTDGADGEQEGSGRSRRRRRRGRDRAENAEGAPGETEGEPVEVAGLLDLRDDGYGFLRVNGFLPGRDDVYVSVKQCRQLGLRKGDHLTGLARPATHKEKNPALTRVETVNGMDPDAARNRPRFDDQTPVTPSEAIELAGGHDDLTARLVAGLAPINKGQRALLRLAPGAERSGVLGALAGAVEASNPDLQLIVLSIGSRPEDVTVLRRIVEGGEVVASTFDRPSEEHTAVAELTVEHAKRLVEYGHDVVILVDGLTALARAFNATVPPGGRLLTGGLDAAAAYPVRRFLGAARTLEEGGSLTLVAELLVETGSPFDDAVADELRGVTNRELRLDGDPAVVPTLDTTLPPAGQQSLLDEIARTAASA